MQFNLSKSLLAVLLGAGVNKAAARLPSKDRKLAREGPFAVVANRVAGSVSFIAEHGNAGCEDVTTVHIKGSEPMYVNANEDSIFVGDRSNNAIIVFDPADILNPSSIPVDDDECGGLFHQWINEDYYVATCTNTNSIVVMKLTSSELFYIDLDALGGGLGGCAPHDIVINEDDEIFVTTFGSCDNEIIKIDGIEIGGSEVARAIAGNNVDPHVALTDTEYLYSPQQKKNGGAVVVYDQADLGAGGVQTLDVPNAHGICFSPDGTNLFVTDINGASSAGRRLIEIVPKQGSDDAELTGAEAGVTERGGAHNCAVTASGKIFVTHSAPGAPFPEAVTLFRTAGKKGGRKLINEGSYLSDPYGSNPFGLGIFNGDIGGLP